jgi:hypothetical protein
MESIVMNTIRLFVFFLLFVSLAYSVEIDVRPSNTIKVDSKDVDLFKYYLKKVYRIYIPEYGAKKIAEENRILANEFLKNYGLSENDKRYLKLITEKYLSEKFVEKFQKENAHLDEKVLLSYYLDNKDKFKNEDEVYVVMFAFDNPEKAIRFYNASNESNKKYEEVEKLAKELNATIKEKGWVSVKKIKQPFRSIIEKKKKGGLALFPEMVSSNSFIVLYSKEYKKREGYKPFEKVRKTIEQFLLKETFNDFRNQLLKKYKSKVHDE